MTLIDIKPLEDAVSACDTIIRKYPDPLELPPSGRWHYHQGVFLLSVLRVGEYLDLKGYREYVDRWTDGLISSSGKIDYAVGELDALQAGNLLFHRIDSSRNCRFRTALDSLISILKDFPRTDQGGFWHKHKYPNQQWLDGLYMIGPLCARYARLAEEPGWLDEMVMQAELIESGTVDTDTGLLRHGFDRSGRAEWTQKDEIRAPVAWGRALGWFPAALLDMIDWYPENHTGKNKLESMFRRLIPPIIKFRDERSGLWFQVLDKGDDPENWTETSCSSLFIYSLAKGVRSGLLDRSVEETVISSYHALTNLVDHDSSGNSFIRDICIGTGIGNHHYYLERPRTVNDLHGAGAFVMAALETARLVDG